MAQFEAYSLDEPEVRLQHILNKNTVFALSENAKSVLPNGEAITLRGGTDALLTELNSAYQIQHAQGFGSAFNDEVHFLLKDNEELLGGISFWDSLHFSDTSVLAFHPGKALAYTRFSSDLVPLMTAVLSSPRSIRSGNAIINAEGRMVTTGWCNESLWLHDSLIIDDFNGVFIIEWDANMEPVHGAFWPCTGRVDDAEILLLGSDVYANVIFLDSLVLDQKVVSTRRSNVANTVLIRLSEELETRNHQFFRSTFDNRVMCDYDLKTEVLTAYVQFRGRMTVGENTIDGLPLTDQTTRVQMYRNLSVIQATYWKSLEGCSLNPGFNSTYRILSGQGVYDHWNDQPPAPSTWIGVNTGSSNPVFIPFSGEDVIIDKLLTGDDRMAISGMYKGNLEVSNYVISNDTELYEPFLLSFELSDNYFDNVDYKVFPNPVSDYFSVNPLPPDEEYIIYDTYGRLVSKGHIQQAKIDIRTLASGMYFLEFSVENRPVLIPFVKTDISEYED